MRRVAAVGVTAVLALTGAGCGERDAPAQRAATSGVALEGDFTDVGAGSLLSATTLPEIDRRIRASTSVAARITYRSTGSDDRATDVSGALFAPIGDAPPGGWPLVAYGHASTGVLPECGPSLSPTLAGSADAVLTLVREGYVVVLPDYQGLGAREPAHPYLDPVSAGRNVIDAVRASRRLGVPVTDRWAALGVSQGGQAVWSANEQVRGYGDAGVLMGTVSVSPPTDLTGFVDAATTGTLTAAQVPALQWILASWGAGRPDVDLDDYRSGTVAQRWDTLTQCVGAAGEERAAVLAGVGPDDLRPATAEAAERLRLQLQAYSLPRAPAATPMLVVYGGEDALLPPAWTDRGLRSACALGDVIDINYRADGQHGDFDYAGVLSWLRDRLADAVPANSCIALLAPEGGGR